MAIDWLTINFFDLFSEIFCNILIGGPVDRHTQRIAIDFFELFFQLGIAEPVVSEPV